MGLRDEQAAANRAFLEDSVAGFAGPITVRDPTEYSAEVNGFANDIANEIDPQTGMVVTGRTASVAFSIATLEAAGFKTLPRARPEKTSYPWVIRFSDVNGKHHTFEVLEAKPDLHAGLVTCTLRAYKD